MADVSKGCALLLGCFFFAGALACEYPDQGNLPLRRAVSKVRTLPEVEAWSAHMHKARVIVHYAVLLDEPHVDAGRCYWPVDVRAGERLWRRYYVTPDGRRLIAKG